MTDYKIIRGPWGKPWVTRDFGPIDWPEGAKEPLNGHLYERPSDVAGNLDTKENLSPYHQSQAVFGVVTEPQPTLIQQFRALASLHTDPWNQAKGEVKELLKLARLYGGEERKSGSGTAIHNYTEVLDRGQEPEYPIPAFRDWLECYQEAMQCFDVLDWECFVVTDDLDNPGELTDLRTAGSFDKLLRANRDITVGGKVVMGEGEVLVGDVKAGKQDNEYAMKPTIQVATYAHGIRYDQETGRRWPIHQDLSLTRGVLIHIPFNGGGQPRCEIYPLDLERGWQLAQMSADITRARRMRAYKRDILSSAKRDLPEKAPQT